MKPPLSATMFRPALAAALAAVGVGLTTGLAGAAEPPATVDYVALGDSYAAGVGAGAMAGACRVSDGAYPKLWAATATPAGAVTLTLAACSGAPSADVRDKQLSALSEDTDLVTVTAGANDLDLVEALEVCADSARAQECAAKLAAIQAGLTATLPADLGRTTAAVAKAAPNAKIAVVGYPLPFEGAAECPRVPLPKALRDAGDAAIAGVNRILQAQAGTSGAFYVDVAARFAGHGLCSAAPWLVGIEGLAAETVLHPTVQGQTEGYLPALTAAVGTPEDVLARISERDRPSQSASAAPSVTTTAVAGGSGGGTLPITGTNIWWIVGVGLALLVAGAFAYRILRPTA